jgi:hypothetical protein
MSVFATTVAEVIAPNGSPAAAGVPSPFAGRPRSTEGLHNWLLCAVDARSCRCLGHDRPCGPEKPIVSLPPLFLIQLRRLCACRWYRLSQELYYTNRLPIDIWVPPIPTHRPNRNAIITFIFEPGLALSAAVLGHSISRYRNAANLEEGGELAEQCANVDMVLVYLEGVIGAGERNRLEEVGWTLRPVERVHGPEDAEEPQR